MSSFEEMFKQQQQFVNSDDNNGDFQDSERPEPKNPRLILNGKRGIEASKRKPLPIRLVPYKDRMYNYDYRQLWVTLHNKEGKPYNWRLVIEAEPKKNDDGNFITPEDKLAKIVKEIVHINYTERQNNPDVYKNTDAIQIQEHREGQRFYPARLATMHTVQVVVLNNDGTYKQADLAKKMPTIQMLDLSNGAFKNVASTVMSSIPYTVTNPEGTDTELGFNNFDEFGLVTKGNTVFTTIFKGDEQTSPLQLDVREKITVGALPSNWADKDDKGEFIFMDDPAVFNKPTKLDAPNIYEAACIELQARLDQWKAQHGQSNPYSASQQPTQSQQPVTPINTVTSPYTQQKVASHEEPKITDPTQQVNVGFDNAVQEATNTTPDWANDATPNTSAQDIPSSIPTADDLVKDTNNTMPPTGNATPTTANADFQKQIDQAMQGW